jgi:hypothetical protein
MFSEATKELITTASILWKIDAQSLLAVIEAESGGKTLVKVQDQREPAITFHQHHFYRRISGAKLETAVREGLAVSEEPTGNPPTQSARWRMLGRAVEIDRKAAYESTRWGMGQILGAHWAWLGFASVDALAREARSGPHGQLNLMLRYIEKADLVSALRTQDWERFASGYRGPSDDHREYRYQLAQAYRRHSEPRGRHTPRRRVEHDGNPVPGLPLSTLMQRARRWLDDFRHPQP